MAAAINPKRNSNQYFIIKSNNYITPFLINIKIKNKRLISYAQENPSVSQVIA